VNLRLRVPATTSNLGPGFDCFGMAVDRYLEVEVRTAERLSVSAEGAQVALDASNLVVRTAQQAMGDEVPALAYHLRIGIPLARGLGSSAAARVAGLAIAQLAKGEPVDRQRIAVAATELEGHPDNAVAAVYGGFCASGPGGQFERVQMEPRRYLVAIPEVEIHTEAARRALPPSLSYPQAVFNLQRATLAAMRVARRRDLAAMAPFEDAWHQAHRLALEPRLQQAFEAARQAPGVGGLFLSGSGPTVFCVPSDEAQAHLSLQRAFEAVGLPARIEAVAADNHGLAVEPL
jgi:homoserine kinase